MIPSRPTFLHRPAFLGLALACLLAFSGTAQAWWNSEWTIRKKITIDATDKGGDVSDPIGTVTILVRLHDGNFQFGAGKDDLSDLRFVAADDKTQLPFHIEKYDDALHEAFVWVKVPDVKPGAQTSFWMYYGNTSEKAQKVENAKGSYDADTTLVYHFGEHGAPANDYSSLGNNAKDAGVPVDGSMIGGGLRFGGHTPVTIPASASLDWGAGEKFTISAWIEPMALKPDAKIISRQDDGNAFIVGLNNDIPYVEVQSAAGAQRSPAGEPIAVKTWKELTVVSDGSKVSLYVNGALYAAVNAAVPALNSDILLGGDSNGGTGFNGEMDELEISRVARPAGFVKVAAISQAGGETKLFIEDPDEQTSSGWFSGGFGLFGVLLKSVTIDGWVVIGILAIMAAVSWFVMVTKFFYLQRIAKGTDEFLKEWSRVSADLTQIDHSDLDAMKTMGGADAKTQALMHQAPLYHIYHIGSEEIRHRLASAKESFNGLSARSIQAIRASLDGGLVRESHNLNGLMVFLTIAIAGGPYMGLLGTVIGVMITFAEIASSGEVNINAIAPGIAAALIATVAGLVVAIPALFGYNYLNARIKDLMSTMQMFTDEFVTKMAEYYPPSSE